MIESIRASASFALPDSASLNASSMRACPMLIRCCQISPQPLAVWPSKGLPDCQQRAARIKIRHQKVPERVCFIV